MFNSQAGMLLQRIQIVTASSQGGIYARLDENRALMDLLQAQAPSLLEQYPCVAQWIQQQHAFLLSLFEASNVRHLLPAPQQFPRLMPTNRAPNEKAHEQLSLEV